jgi:hypothetical protein
MCRGGGGTREPVDRFEVLGERLLAAVPSNALVAVSDAQGRMLLRSKDASFWMGLPLPDALRAMVGDDQADAPWY